jgi:hypothetical protein
MLTGHRQSNLCKENSKFTSLQDSININVTAVTPKVCQPTWQVCPRYSEGRLL